MNRVTVTISPELDSALTQASIVGRVSKSHLIETFLREHKEVQKHIENVRAEPDSGQYVSGRLTRTRTRTH